MDQDLVKALNNQVNEELKSAYLYASMAADFFHKGYPGMALWMTSQYKEEMEHGIKIHRYLDERGERVFYQDMPAPQASWETPRAAFEAALKHEKYISGCIFSLTKQARACEDISTEVFLQWFVNEQVEEESSVQAILDKLDMVGDSKMGLYQLDKELGARK